MGGTVEQRIPQRRGSAIGVRTEPHRRLPDRPEPRFEPAGPLLAEARQLPITTGPGQFGKLAKQRRHVLDVENGEADDHPGIGAAIGDGGSRPGNPGTQALGHRATVKAVRRGARSEGREQVLRLGHALLEAVADRRPGQCRQQLLPVLDQLARRGIQLPVGTVLGRMQLSCVVCHGEGQRSLRIADGGG